MEKGTGEGLGAAEQVNGSDAGAAATNWREWVLWLLLPIFAVSAAVVLLQDPSAALPEPEAVNTCFALLLNGFLLLTLVYLLVLAILALFDRPRPSQKDEDLPGCTVIVPAYNEGRHVAETLATLLECDYPAEKLQLIAVNDGSQDDTREWIQKAVRASNGRIQMIDQPENRGKKHAIYAGVRQARHEIIVTVDSDSIPEKEALRNLVAPFADPGIGAVAGNIRAKNRDAGFIASLLDVMLIFGCEFLRAGQSVTGTVFCTPGALSAYRRSAIEPVMDEWLDQTFLGVPARIGEDRAIATLLLRNGWRIVHQCNALALTCVPENYSGICKMLIRWTRSDIREDIVMAGFVMRNLVRLRGWALLLHWFSLTTGVLMPFLLIPGFIRGLIVAENMPEFLLASLLSSLICAVIPVMVYARRAGWLRAVWAFVFGWYFLFALSWIVPYSLFTIRNSKWMTRDLPERKVRKLRYLPRF